MRFPTSSQTRYFFFVLALVFSVSAQAAIDARSAGLTGDGATDDTDALQKILGDGEVEVVFPKGVYLLGTVNVPAKTTLRGEPGAVIRINTARMRTYDPAQKRAPKGMNPNFGCVFALHGNDVRIDGLTFDFTLVDASGVTAEQRPDAIIFAKNVSNITLSGLVAERLAPGPMLPVEKRKVSGVGGGRYQYEMPPTQQWFHLSYFQSCHNILMEGCRATQMNCMLAVTQCSRIVSRGNRAEDCYSITRCAQGDEFLLHEGNWSRGVTHQCRWSGGNANDRRNLKEGDVGWGTATTVERMVKPEDPNFNRYTAGEFDIMVVNNYAEHGQTLAWGAKGRQILFKGNIGRFFSDYGLGSEGGENVIYQGNIIINGMSGGLVSMYWGEKLLISGNIVLTRNEPIDMNYSRYSNAEAYQGGMIRLHAASSPSGSGSGQALITGNVLVCELPNQNRSITIHSGRDVQITGNKIRNGRIFKKGRGTLLVNDNEFIMTSPHSGPWVHLYEAQERVVISDNVFQSKVPLEQRSPTEMLILSDVERKVTEGVSPLKVIENNLMEGFPLAMWLRSSGKGDPNRFVARNNLLDGVIRVEGVEESRKLLLENNRNVKSLEPVNAEILNQEPEKMPEFVQPPTQTINADADNEAREKASENGE